LIIIKNNIYKIYKMIDIYWAYLLERRLKNDLNEENIKKDKDKKEKAKKEKKINKDVCAFCGQNINFCICNLYQ